MSNSERLLHALAEQESELIQMASDLIGFPTQSPPGRNSAACQQFVGRMLAAAGFELDVFDLYAGDPIVVGKRHGRGGGRSLILNGHVDVAVAAPSDGWSQDPHQATQKDGRLIGRGAADMKGAMAAVLHVATQIERLGIVLDGDLIIESVVGEEVGEAGTKACCDRGYRADLAIVCDTSNLELQGQGGVITGWITVQSPTVHHDGQRARMLHAGGGLFGASAIEKMAKIIGALGELERHWAVLKRYPGFPAGSTTINPAVIEGGRHPAFVADRAALWITVHFYPDETVQSVTREIETHIMAMAQSDPWLRQHPPSFRWGGTSMIEDRGEMFPAFSLDAASAGAALLGQAHCKVTGKAAVQSMSATVTDGGWLAHAGVPTILYGPGELSEAHAVNESVSIEQLRQYANVLGAFLLSYCQEEAHP